MGATPFKSTSWADNEPIYTEKLNQMTNNDQWLFENTPRMYFRGAGSLPNRANGTKALAGFCLMRATKSGGARTTVLFNNHFTSGCKPAVVTTAINGVQGRVYTSVSGIGNASLVDHRGMYVRAFPETNPKLNRLTKSCWVSYIAIGY